MSTTELVFDDVTISAPRIDLFLKRRDFLEDPALAESFCSVTPSVAPAAFKQFHEAI
jgi:hypothetical protein